MLEGELEGSPVAGEDVAGLEVTSSTVGAGVACGPAVGIGTEVVGAGAGNAATSRAATFPKMSAKIKKFPFDEMLKACR